MKNTDFEQVPVPTNLVNQAIRQGVAEAAPRRSRRRWHRGVALAATVVVAAGFVMPVTIQAGGLVPAYQQVLDPSDARTEHFDPTLNYLLGNMNDPSHYHALDVPAQTVGGVKVQPLGTLATAGVIAVVVDYQGPGLHPEALKHAMASVVNHGAGQDIDVEINAAKVAVGHYRQVLAWYPPITDSANVTSFDLTLNAVNRSKQALTFKQLTPPRFTTQTRAQALNKTVRDGKMSVGITKIIAGSQSFLIDYQSRFAAAAFAGRQKAAYEQAAWISEADVIRDGKRVGDLVLGVGGASLATQTRGGQVTANFQSLFLNRYRVGVGDYRKLQPGDKVVFFLDLPGHNQRQHVANFTIAASQLLP